MVKLLKFRPLANERDYGQIKDIVEKGKFWCSKLWNLNDPMEGLYRNRFFSSENISQMFSDKNNYVICAFSEEKAIKNPLLWGYYANGFKGIAIEIEIDESEIIKDENEIIEIEYLTKEDFCKDLSDVKEIITQKLEDWDHEIEYRYLKKSSKEEAHKIGKITKIYLGTPYFNINNRQNVKDNSFTLRKYDFFKNELILLCKKKKIPTENYNLKLGEE